MNSLNSAVNTESHNERKIHEFEEINIPVPWGYISGLWWGPSDVQPIIALHGWQDNAGTFWNLAPLLSKDVSILSIDLPGHGKWWGPREKQPIIALHGRQDNAGSFDNLVPLLSTNVSVLCLDLPGHGLSSHFPKGHMYYIYWEGITLLRRIVKYYKWNKVKLLGHSLGGAISFMYAASYPEEVDFVISLDIVSPNVKNINDCAKVTGDQIDKFLKYENLMADSAPCYEYNVMIDIVHNAYKGSITRKNAEILMKRGMQPALDAGKYYFSRDPRLKVAFIGMLSLDLVIAYACQIKCAYLNIRAVPGMVFDEPENYHKILEIIKNGSKKFEYHEVEGTHHVHLNNPERIAPIINEFLRLQ